MPGDWASTANPADLEALARALEQGRLDAAAPSLSALQTVGVADPGAARAFLASAPAPDAGTLAWCLRRLASERRASADRFARCAQLVWSGHGDSPQPLRDTRAVLDEVCVRAERHVTLATYVVHDGLRSLAALARRMRELPALQVDLYVDVKSPDRRPLEEVSVTVAWLARFRERHWPADVRLPSVWYDPQALDRAAGTSLHAKCVVADERWAFVTSANFTEAAQRRNIEVGVLLDHPALAQALCAQFQGLRDRGSLRRVPGT